MDVDASGAQLLSASLIRPGRVWSAQIKKRAGDRRGSRRQNRVVLASFRGVEPRKRVTAQAQATVASLARSPGRARHKPPNPLRGEVLMLERSREYRTLVRFFIRARLSGVDSTRLPRALSYKRDANDRQSSGDSRRENEDVCLLFGCLKHATTNSPVVSAHAETHTPQQSLLRRAPMIDERNDN